MSTSSRFDLVVVGGGIHGVGVAQAAAAAGHSVLLLEKTALAAGTSSRSSKLIHGGLRYLESMQFSLVRESLRERELLLRIASGLVRRQRFYIPLYRHTARRVWYLRAGLSTYAMLAGMRRGTRFRSVPRKQWTQLDGLCTTNLMHVFQYWDAQTDDAALTAAVMRSASSLGAELACPAEFKSAEVTSDGCHVNYESLGQSHAVHCQALVNAGGPWASQIAAKISPPVAVPKVELVQGSHIELPGEIRQGCYYMESRVDGRAVFVIPWKNRTMVGTTEVVHRGAPEAARATTSEVDYLLAVYHEHFPGRSLEVLDRWAGLRVLPAATGSAFGRSRETHLPTDRQKSPRVVAIFGGKLTGYRVTAEKVMRVLRSTLPERKAVADTSTQKLS